jgi:hypothetical protein
MQAFYNKGIALVTLNKLEEAIDALNKVIQINP